jgi:hypothetical protein
MAFLLLPLLQSRSPSAGVPTRRSEATLTRHLPSPSRLPAHSFHPRLSRPRLRPRRSHSDEPTTTNQDDAEVSEHQVRRAVDWDLTQRGAEAEKTDKKSEEENRQVASQLLGWDTQPSSSSSRQSNGAGGRGGVFFGARPGEPEQEEQTWLNKHKWPRTEVNIQLLQCVVVIV